MRSEFQYETLHSWSRTRLVIGKAERIEGKEFPAHFDDTSFLQSISPKTTSRSCEKCGLVRTNRPRRHTAEGSISQDPHVKQNGPKMGEDRQEQEVRQYRVGHP